jgi:hypothetical protein
LEVYILDAHYLVLRRFTPFGSSEVSTNGDISWLIYKCVDIIRYRAVQHPAVIASGIITNFFIIISVLSAFPWVRKLVVPVDI